MLVLRAESNPKAIVYGTFHRYPFDEARSSGRYAFLPEMISLQGYASTQSKPMKYDYGHEVVLRTNDDAGETALRPCAVVGITLVQNENQAAHFHYAVGTVLYTVEFGDGSDALVPEGALCSTDDQS